MKQILSNVDWVSILDTHTNDAWLLCKSIIDKCVPTYKQRGKKNLYTNSDVFCLKRQKNKLWKKYLYSFPY